MSIDGMEGAGAVQEVTVDWEAARALVSEDPILKDDLHLQAILDAKDPGALKGTDIREFIEARKAFLTAHAEDDKTHGQIREQMATFGE